MFKVDTSRTDWRGAYPIVYLDAIESKDDPLWWHLRGLQETTRGYGSRLTSRMKVRTEPAGPWRRVYVAQISNAGTAYVVVRGERVCVRGAL